MRQYYIKKLIEYAAEGLIEISIRTIDCVDSFVYKMYVKYISSEIEQSFNISAEDKNMIELISKIENIKNITII